MTFDRAKQARLHKAYSKAIDNKQLDFLFEGTVFLTNYAKYLLEHLDMTLNPKKAL